MFVGQKIREARLKKGITQSELSDGIVTASMVSQIESDKAQPSYQLLQAIAKRLELPVDFFLSDVEDRYEQDYRLLMSEALVELGQASQVYEKHPSDYRSPWAELYTGLGYLQLNRYKEAFTYLERLLHEGQTLQEPELRFQVLLGISRAAECLQEFSLAQNLLEEAESLATADHYLRPFSLIEVTVAKVRLYLRQGLVNKAIDVMKQFDQGAPEVIRLRDLAVVYVQKAKEFKAQGDYHHAVSYTQQAVALLRGLRVLQAQIDMQAERIRLAAEQGYVELAMEGLQKIKQESQSINGAYEPVQVLVAQVDTYYKTGHIQEALRLGQKLLEHENLSDWDRGDLYEVMISIQLDQEQWNAAKNLLAKGFACCDGELYTKIRMHMYQLQSEWFKRQGMYKEAVEILEEMTRWISLRVGG